MPLRFRFALAIALAGIAITPVVRAAGFQLQNQTGSGNGNAFAGAAAAADDAGTVFFNPAGMTLLPAGHSVALAGTLLDRSVRLSGGSVSGLLPAPSTSNGKDGGGSVFLSAVYWSYPLDPSLRIGLGISPTFGNKTDYGFDFIGRYSGYRAEIQQINVNPALAWQLNEQWSLGAGINYAQNDTEFRQGSPLPSPLAGNDLTVKGGDHAWGYNLGLLFRPQPATRLALTYRSELSFRLHGTLDSNLTPVIDSPVRSRLTTPAHASFAVAHQLNDRIELRGDLSWTGWHSVNTLDVIARPGGTLLNSLSYRFRDTWRVGAGVNYRYNDKWTLRAGIAWDQTPVRSAADRTMTLPDSDRTWLAFGVRYQLGGGHAIDAGYAHVFFADAPTARAVRDASGTIVQTIRGQFDSRADLLSLQWSYHFL